MMGRTLHAFIIYIKKSRRYQYIICMQQKKADINYGVQQARTTLANAIISMAMLAYKNYDQAILAIKLPTGLPDFALMQYILL